MNDRYSLSLVVVGKPTVISLRSTVANGCLQLIWHNCSLCLQLRMKKSDCERSEQL